MFLRKSGLVQYFKGIYREGKKAAHWVKLFRMRILRLPNNHRVLNSKWQSGFRTTFGTVVSYVPIAL
jgi:hypothetical protein